MFRAMRVNPHDAVNYSNLSMPLSYSRSAEIGGGAHIKNAEAQSHPSASLRKGAEKISSVSSEIPRSEDARV